MKLTIKVNVRVTPVVACILWTMIPTSIACGDVAVVPYIPSITQLYTVAEQGGKELAAAEAYKKIQDPFFVIAANNSMAIATIFFAQGADSNAILQLASDRLARYGALTLYGFGSGLTKPLLTDGTSYSLYLKPITLGSIGIIGMTVVCSAIPLPFVASSAYSVFQGMTMTSGITLAKNMLQKGVNTQPVKEALTLLRKPETALFNNAVIIAGTVGIMAATPLLLTYAGAVATTALATQITATMALSAALDITEELSKAAVYTHAVCTGTQVATTATSKPLSAHVREGWQNMKSFFTTFMGQAGSFIEELYDGPSTRMLEMYGGELE
jgi:hypothetical protein